MRQRGCGNRKEDALYSCLGAGPNGRPLESFFFDPPRIMPVGMDIPSLGVHIRAQEINRVEPEKFLEVRHQYHGAFLPTKTADSGKFIVIFNPVDDEYDSWMDVCGLFEIEYKPSNDFVDALDPALEEWEAFEVEARHAPRLKSHPYFHAFANAEVHHIFDVVGKQHYPFLPDFIDEARSFLAKEGIAFSRRLPRNNHMLNLLSKYSRHFLLHDCAYLENWRDYLNEDEADGRFFSPWVCQFGHDFHDGDVCAHPKQMPCLSSLWCAIDDGVPPYKLHKRERPHGSYWCSSSPEGVYPVFQRAIFASFPVQIQLVKGQHTDHIFQSTAETRERGVNVEIVES
jgi:hypothetical protein